MRSARSNPSGLLEKHAASSGPRRWRRDDLASDDWLITLPERCWPELDEVASAVRAEQPAITSLQADRFDLAGCAEVMATVRRRLTDGIGFAVLDKRHPHVLGTVVGAIFVGVLLNGLTMLNAPYYTQDFVKGVVLVGALAMTFGLGKR